MIVTLADPETPGSSTETAVTVTGLGLGTIVGAVYNPFGEIAPAAALPPTTPLTSQVTAKFVAFLTVAKNCLEACTDLLI